MDDELRCDYYGMFIKEAIKDLKEKGVAYVFSEEQVKSIKKILPIKVTKKDEFCIEIRLY